MLLMLSAPAEPSPARVAVISDADNQNLAALVTTELSGRPDISLVERDDLAKVGDELKLQQLAGSDAVALGKLIGADGLLFIKKDGEQTVVRLTAVGLGFVLLDLTLPAGTAPDVAAKALSDRVAQFGAKMKLPPGRAIPLSVIDLRPELTAVSSDKVAHQLTLLLESRLSSIPEVVVLERRHADALGFERSLSTASSSLLTGAYLIDGSFRFYNLSDEISVSLRIRSPYMGRESASETKGSVKDIPPLANAIADQIIRAIGSTDSALLWQPKNEAKEYFEEALWDRKHGQNDAALAALDSSVLLNAAQPRVLAERIRTLCDLEHAVADDRPTFPQPDELLEKRLDLLRRAMQDLIAIREGDKANGAAISQPHPDLEQCIFYRASWLLGELEDKPLVGLADDFRHELRTLSGYDPIHGHIPPCLFPEDMSDSVEEETAFYMTFARRAVPWYPDPKKAFKRTGQNPDGQRKAYEQFMEKLRADPGLRLVYLTQVVLFADPATRDATYPQFIQEFWNERERFYPLRTGNYEVMIGEMDVDMRKKYAGLSVPFYHYAFSKPSIDIQGLKTTFHPEWLSPAQAAEIWSDLEHRISLSDPLQDYDHLYQLKVMEGIFLKAFPTLPISISTSHDTTPRLEVNRLWFYKNLDEPNPDMVKEITFPDAPLLRPQFFSQSLIPNFEPSPDGESVWGLIWRNRNIQERSGLFEVHLPDMKTTFLDTDCGRPYGAARTSNAYYVRCGDYLNVYIKRYDLKTHTWEQRRMTDVGESDYYQVADQLYFNLSAFGRAGVARYDWDTDKIKILVSDRRNPPLNQLDGKDSNGTLIFMGPGGKLCMFFDGLPYYVQEEPGNWPRMDLEVARYFQNVTSLGRSTLLSIGGGEVVLIDPDKPAPIFLMAPDQPTQWHPQPGSGKPVMSLPPWAAQAFWRFPAIKGRSLGPVTFYAGHLYSLDPPNLERTYYELFVWGPERPYPSIIPLRFVASGLEEKTLFVAGAGPGGVNAVKDGLCLNNNSGFWFLPYADIEAYMKSNPNLVHTP
jgi:regulator of extracellular matrix RemA (YlzA/DUF370 family)